MALGFNRNSLPHALQTWPFSLVRLLPQEVVVPSEGQKQAWRQAAQRTDVIADNLVKAFKANGKLGREQFNQALEHGIETVNQPLPELVTFFNAMEATPFWVDHQKIRTAQEALTRVPPEVLYSVMLSFGLPASYISSKVNQTLSRAGGLELKAASRLVETTGWLTHCIQPGGLAREGQGFKQTAQVRLVHAFIRSGLQHTGDWDYENWDVPINQAQQALTLLPFILGVYLTIPLGNLMSWREIKAVLHLWRYISHLMGIEPELQITSFTDVPKMLWLTGWAELEVDELTPILHKALQNTVPLIYNLPTTGKLAKPAQWLAHQYIDNLSRMLMGVYHSDALGTPKLNPMAGLVVGISAVRLALDIPLQLIPGANKHRIAHNIQRHNRFFEQVSQRVKADLSFNRDQARLNEARIKQSAQSIADATSAPA